MSLENPSTTEMELIAVRKTIKVILGHFDIVANIKNAPAPIQAMMSKFLGGLEPAKAIEAMVDNLSPDKAESIIQACYDLVATLESGH